jgi:hypothetical protein
MVFVLWFKFDPSHAHRVLGPWKQFNYPGKVKVLNRVLLIGIHESPAIFDAPDAESLLKSLRRSMNVALHLFTRQCPLKKR